MGWMTVFMLDCVDVLYRWDPVVCSIGGGVSVVSW